MYTTTDAAATWAYTLWPNAMFWHIQVFISCVLLHTKYYICQETTSRCGLRTKAIMHMAYAGVIQYRHSSNKRADARNGRGLEEYLQF